MKEATKRAASEALAQMLAVTAMLVIASFVFSGGDGRKRSEATSNLSPSFRDAPLGAGPESITTIGSMDSGLRSARPGMTR